MGSKLVHVWNFGRQNPVMLFLTLEDIGVRLGFYYCCICRCETGHHEGRVGENEYVVCSECGEGSKVVE